MNTLGEMRPELEYCTVYHCAGDCGHPHNQDERTQFALALAPDPTPSPATTPETDMDPKDALLSPAQVAAEMGRLRRDNAALLAACEGLLYQINNAEVLGEWSALDMNIKSQKVARLVIDTAVVKARAAIAQAQEP